MVDKIEGRWLLDCRAVLIPVPDPNPDSDFDDFWHQFQFQFNSVRDPIHIWNQLQS